MRYVEKPWGSETIFAHTENYVGKILKINAGHKLSLQYHEKKQETIYVLSGKLLLHIGLTEEEVKVTTLSVGEPYQIDPGMIHRFEAETDCELCEVSTTELDDVVRLKDDYGREGT